MRPDSGIASSALSSRFSQIWLSSPPVAWTGGRFASTSSVMVAPFVFAFEATLAILERAGRLKWYRAERGARRTWLPTRITLPDYHPLYRWGAYNFYMRARD